MTDSEIRELFLLHSVPGVGHGRLRLLLSKFGSARNVLNASVRSLQQLPGIDKTTAVRIKTDYDKKFAEHQIHSLHLHQGNLITFMDKEYPSVLKNIYDPPAFLFLNGSYRAKDEMALAVVGTRDPSVYGQQVTRILCRSLVERGFTIVSGLARGIDTIAHVSALENGGRTLAVLGSGLDCIYPPENRGLARKIAAAGAVISEFTYGTMPDSGNFPRRNRIISGLSHGVLVIEAGLKSGALITAFEALDQNREVFAVPGSILSVKSAGTNRLLKEGAILVRSIDDILAEIDPSLQAGANHAERRLPELQGSEKMIFEHIGQEPVHIDKIARITNKTPGEILSVLLTLELLGYVRQLTGKMFIRT